MQTTASDVQQRPEVTPEEFKKRVFAIRTAVDVVSFYDSLKLISRSFGPVRLANGMGNEAFIGTSGVILRTKTYTYNLDDWKVLKYFQDESEGKALQTEYNVLDGLFALLWRTANGEVIPFFEYTAGHFYKGTPKGTQ